jgi:hypothetical protein
MPASVGSCVAQDDICEVSHVCFCVQTNLPIGGLGTTHTAMEPGYDSASAFIYAFRTEMGRSPHSYMGGRLKGQEGSVLRARGHAKRRPGARG